MCLRFQKPLTLWPKISSPEGIQQKTWRLGDHTQIVFLFVSLTLQPTHRNQLRPLNGITTADSYIMKKKQKDEEKKKQEGEDSWHLSF